MRKFPNRLRKEWICHEPTIDAKSPREKETTLHNGKLGHLTLNVIIFTSKTNKGPHRDTPKHEATFINPVPPPATGGNNFQGGGSWANIGFGLKFDLIIEKARIQLKALVSQTKSTEWLTPSVYF